MVLKQYEENERQVKVRIVVSFAPLFQWIMCLIPPETQ